MQAAWLALVIDVRIHETSLQKQVPRYRSQEFGKNPGGSG